MSGREGTAARLAALEERVARIEAATGQLGEDTFWALNGLLERGAQDSGQVLFTGATALPNGEHYRWQQGAPTDWLLGIDWSELSGSFAALGHPVRMLLVQKILAGTRTAAELAELAELGTTGQLYHHLKQLVAAGWLETTGRGRYAVPGARVIPLLVVVATAALPLRNLVNQSPTAEEDGV
ncbi:helix-turn-helix domain-containing protein [Sciscionella sediminilitoris]|uniref:helix-turn-helix domain-containing protein n=1 Tax=Sciscionella sediminilitoris TaxID=1445613 RepID=UPI00056D7DE3|nr:helix-turn-helix domain-containing protein [Sciscionella sp. SE31]